MDVLVAESQIGVKSQSITSTEDFEKAIPLVKPAVLEISAHALDDPFVRA